MYVFEVVRLSAVQGVHGHSAGSDAACRFRAECKLQVRGILDQEQCLMTACLPAYSAEQI